MLLDVKAAFDSLWHEGLIYRIFNLNFPNYLIKIIESFLCNRTFNVHIGASHTELFNIYAGCPQGSCLFPTLYNIYTSDFPQLANCTISVFADDTAILCSDILYSNISANLQIALNKMFNYFNKWKITLNASITKAIYFTRKRKP